VRFPCLHLKEAKKNYNIEHMFVTITSYLKYCCLWLTCSNNCFLHCFVAAAVPSVVVVVEDSWSNLNSSAVQSLPVVGRTDNSLHSNLRCCHTC
jgi:hypothetical protein